MLESDLFIPLKNGLEQLGFEVFGEVSLSYTRAIDCVALKNKKFIIGIELKLLNTQKVLQQARRTSFYCHYTFIGTPVEPNQEFLTRCSNLGVGFLLIKENYIKMISQPKLRKPIRNMVLHPASKTQTGGVASGASDKKTIYQQLYYDIEQYLISNKDKAIPVGKIVHMLRENCVGKIPKRKVVNIIKTSSDFFLYNDYVMYLKDYQKNVPTELRAYIEEGINKWNQALTSLKEKN